jgi:hypothetical protein
MRRFAGQFGNNYQDKFSNGFFIYFITFVLSEIKKNKFQTCNQRALTGVFQTKLRHGYLMLPEEATIFLLVYLRTK